MTDATTKPRRFADLPPAQQAGIMCNDPAFQAFVAAQRGVQGEMFSPDGCAEHIRRICGVASRRDLNRSDAARQKFAAIRTEFDAWAGRIPAQRKAQR